MMNKSFLRPVHLKPGETYTIKVSLRNQTANPHLKYPHIPTDVSLYEGDFSLDEGKKIDEKREIVFINDRRENIEGKVLNIMNEQAEKLEENPELNPIIETIKL